MSDEGEAEIRGRLMKEHPDETALDLMEWWLNYIAERPWCEYEIEVLELPWRVMQEHRSKTEEEIWALWFAAVQQQPPKMRKVMLIRLEKFLEARLRARGAAA